MSSSFNKEKQKLPLQNGKNKQFSTIKVISKEENYSKRLQYLQTRKAQSISNHPSINSTGDPHSIPNGQSHTTIQVPEKHNNIPTVAHKSLKKTESSNFYDTTGNNFNRNDSLKCLNDNKIIFKLKSELLEYKTKTEKLQNEINVI
jgi:hypothetical protein